MRVPPETRVQVPLKAACVPLGRQHSFAKGRPGCELEPARVADMLSSFRGAPGAVVESPWCGPGSPGNKTTKCRKPLRGQTGGRNTTGGFASNNNPFIEGGVKLYGTI